jgi:dihydrofolate synthase / folylpolyglutamate synthase
VLDAQRYLADLEPVGWRLGLDRMEALCSALGNPERDYRTLHVVGTNGKSSVTQMTAALLGGAGLRVGACVSPHTSEWRERVRIGNEVIAAEAFGAAAETVAAAIAELEPAFEEGARITQFEAAIAISFVALRDAGVEWAVVEAGLGGRLDATNVIRSEAAALTSVALDHTDWLGETVEEIAVEKLAVLEPGSTLVLGDLSPPVRELAHAHAAGLNARVVEAEEAPAKAVPGDFGPYLRRNAGVALELAALALGGRIGAAASSRALSAVHLGGRFEVLAAEPGLPRTVFDAAHNEEGAVALAEALAATSRGPVVLCVSILADKDSAAIAGALAPIADAVVCTSADPGPAMGRPGAVALSAVELARQFGRAGVAALAEPDPGLACERALVLAAERDGVAVFAGSHYLLRHAWTVRRDQSSSR